MLFRGLIQLALLAIAYACWRSSKPSPPDSGTAAERRDNETEFLKKASTSGAQVHVAQCTEEWQWLFCVNGDCFRLEMTDFPDAVVCRCHNGFTGVRCREKVMDVARSSEANIIQMQTVTVVITGLVLSILVLGMLILAYICARQQRYYQRSLSSQSASGATPLSRFQSIPYADAD